MGMQISQAAIEAEVDAMLARAAKAKRSTPNPEIPVEVSVPLPRIQGLKRRIREVVREAIRDYDGIAYPDEVNTMTNRVYKGVVRPALARVWAQGFEAGSDHVSACCGCSGFGEPPENPYER